MPTALFEERALPEGTFDLIVCAEFLYFWDSDTLTLGLERLRERLRLGGLLALYHAEASSRDE